MFKIIANWLHQIKSRKSPPNKGELSITGSSAVNLDPAPGDYEKSLLERSYEQWHQGNWIGLTALKIDSICHHPERAKLALLTAAGHQQLGNRQATLEFVRLAQNWNASRYLITKILCAGVHNTLGRAAALGHDEQRALNNFQKAVAVARSNRDSEFNAKIRIDEQVRQLNFCSDGKFQIKLEPGIGPNIEIPPSTEDYRGISRPTSKQAFSQGIDGTQQTEELIQIQEHTLKSLKKEISNSTKQIQAFLGLQNYFISGQLPDMNPQSHGWPISPDFALYLIELIELRNYGLYLEFGSGVSTVAMAKALTKKAQKSQNKSITKLISFDHLKEFYQQTRDHLHQAGLTQVVDLHHTPLKEYIASNGKAYPYYDCIEILSETAQFQYLQDLRILVIVDGPPGKTGPHARYPALPIVLDIFKNAQVDFLMDDYSRDEEKEILQLWQRELKLMDYQFTTQLIDLEKGACLLSTSIKSNPTKPGSIFK